MKNISSLRVHVVAALLILVPVVAATMTSTRTALPDENTFGLGAEEYDAAMVFYNHLLDDGMNEAYGYAVGATYGLVGWDNGRSEFKAGSGFLFASGKPLQLSQDWTVESSNIGTVAFPFSAGYAYRLTDGGENSLIPYVGIGAWWLLGLERFDVHLTREFLGGVAEYELTDTSYRHSFVGHVAFGAHKKVSERFTFVGEVRYAHGGKGRLKRRRLTADEISQGWEDVLRDFQHPNYKFTGLFAAIGLRW